MLWYILWYILRYMIWHMLWYMIYYDMTAPPPTLTRCTLVVVVVVFYSLASTYLLSRISVVHHAALNCIRRIFAIVVTSIVFSIPITFLGGCGILVSFGGFMAFSHHKSKRMGQPKAMSSLLPSKTSDISSSSMDGDHKDDNNLV
jgi:hypothetical protein